MADVSVSAKISEFFFDRAKVLEEIGEENAAILSQSLAMIRTIARRSLRRRNGASPPGAPPHTHTKHPYVTLKNILFGLSSNKVSGIVGPVGFNQSRKRGTIQQSRKVPNVHEFGGAIHRVRRVAVRKRKKTGRKATPLQAREYQRLIREGRIHPGGTVFEFKEETANYPKRAFMRPAVETFRDRYPELQRHVVEAG